MAANQQLLQQLVDIAEPPYQLPWQMPLGGYILLTIGLLIGAYVSWRLIKRWRFLAVKRQAIRLVAKVEPEASSQINQLLKRVVQHYSPAHPILSASTLHWQVFLQNQLPAKPLPPLIALLYQGAPDAKQQHQFYQFAQSWLKQLQPDALLTTDYDIDITGETNAGV